MTPCHNTKTNFSTFIHPVLRYDLYRWVYFQRYDTVNLTLLPVHLNLQRHLIMYLLYSIGESRHPTNGSNYH